LVKIEKKSDASSSGKPSKRTPTSKNNKSPKTPKKNKVPLGDDSADEFNDNMEIEQQPHVTIFTPEWRSKLENEDSDSSESSEDTSDEAYTKRHEIMGRKLETLNFKQYMQSLNFARITEKSK